MSAVPAIELRGVSKHFGSVIALRDIDIKVHPGEVHCVIGDNGAGKSTLVKAVAGLVPVSQGRTLLFGHDITRVPAHRMVFEGLAFVPQTDNIFTNLSILENLELAAAIVKADRRERLPPVYAMFPDLERQRHLPAGQLSGGQRQMLAVARALLVRPRVLMLDEPSAGLSPKLVGEVFANLQAIRERGVTIVLVEQNARAALAIGNNTGPMHLIAAAGAPTIALFDGAADTLLNAPRGHVAVIQSPTLAELPVETVATAAWSLLPR